MQPFNLAAVLLPACYHLYPTQSKSRADYIKFCTYFCCFRSRLPSQRPTTKRDTCLTTLSRQRPRNPRNAPPLIPSQSTVTWMRKEVWKWNRTRTVTGIFHLTLPLRFVRDPSRLPRRVVAKVRKRMAVKAMGPGRSEQNLNTVSSGPSMASFLLSIYEQDTCNFLC